MISDTRSHDDRETLCALFDGELQGDAARFALKRLGHDEQWRRTCGRWQLYGDVLRGQAGAVASGDFAGRVAAAIAQEPAAAAASGGGWQRRGWIGGALAASVAMAALFVTRPFSQEGVPSAPSATPPQVASATTAPSPMPMAPTPDAPPTPAPLQPQAPGAELGAAAVAAVEVPRRALERRSTRSQSQRAARRQSEASAIAATAPALNHAEPATAVAAAVPANPFRSPVHVESATRPWPRAVLPQYPASGGALTASYGHAAERSFYPFEPTLASPLERGPTTENDGPPPAPRP